MGNYLIFKIAVGVFLGMAAWTYRADLGTLTLYAIGFFIAAFVAMWCYQIVAAPIKDKLKERKINKLVKQLVSHNLINVNHESALCLGLFNSYAYDEHTTLQEYLENFKRDLSNGGSGDYFKNQINKLALEVVNDFKQSARDTTLLN